MKLWGRGVESYYEEWNIVAGRLSFAVGSGRRVPFWRDKWCGKEPLSVAFPSSYIIAAYKDAFITNVWSLSEGGGCWNPLFARPFNDGEVEEVNNLLFRLKKVHPGMEDKVVWLE